MKQYRVEVKNSSEAKEAISLFSLIGYGKAYFSDSCYPRYVVTNENNDTTGADLEYTAGELITLYQLRTMAKKEYLDENYNLVHHKTDIEVPEGADFAVKCDDGFIAFYGCNVMHVSMFKSDAVVWQRTPSVDKSQWDLQVGGDHYKSMKIQPAKFALENKLDYCQANAIKYICRHESKNGKQDLEKAKHYIDLLIEHYYG